MALAKYNPWTAPTRFNNLLDDFFNGDISNFIGGENAGSLPDVNIKENEKSFEIDVAAPGLEKNDFDVNVDNGVLTISANKEDKHEEENERFTRKEFSYTQFSRSFTLPENVDADKIKGKYKDGVLKVELPKKEEQQSKAGKSIKIE